MNSQLNTIIYHLIDSSFTTLHWPLTMINNNEDKTMQSVETIEMEKKIENREKTKLRMRKYRARRNPEQLSLDRKKSSITAKKKEI